MSDSRQTRGGLQRHYRTMPPVPMSKDDAATLPVDMAALAAALTTVTLWGSAFVGIRAAGETLSPGAIAIGRLITSSVALGAVALVRREPLPPRRALVPVAAYGMLFLGLYS